MRERYFVLRTGTEDYYLRVDDRGRVLPANDPSLPQGSRMFRVDELSRREIATLRREEKEKAKKYKEIK